MGDFWGDLEYLGMFFYYKYLRNQGRKRCKTNVNFQLYIVDREQTLRSKVSCRMEQFMKKRLNLFLLLLNTVEEKKVIFFSFVFVIFEVKFVCVFIFLCVFFQMDRSFFLISLENFENSNCWVCF